MEYSHTIKSNHTPLESEVEDPEENAVFEAVLGIIKKAQGSKIAVNSAIQSAYRRSEQVRTNLGGKLTQRENKRVKNLCLKIITHKNIEVIKHKPQLIVKWSNDKSRRSIDATPSNGGVTAAQ